MGLSIRAVAPGPCTGAGLAGPQAPPHLLTYLEPPAPCGPAGHIQLNAWG